LKNLRWFFVSVLVIILAVGLLVNVGIAAEKKWNIGMSQCNLGEPWRVQMNKDVKDNADKHPEFSVTYKDAQNDALRQVNQVEEFIAAKVDLLIISPKESAPLTAPVGKAIDAGIPVIVLDRKILGDKYTCFIGADNVKIGREAGKYAVKLFNGKASIVELKGLMTSSGGQERHQGFLQGIKDAPGMKVIFETDMKWLEPEARKEMSSALARFDKIDLVFGANDPAAHGAYVAAQSEGKGREKTIKFIGVDALPYEGVRYVKEGIFAATFQYPTGAAEAIELGLALLKDGKQPPKNVVLGTRMFTKDNLDGLAIP
jgi:ribose transport system substrate-binding protein